MSNNPRVFRNKPPDPEIVIVVCSYFLAEARAAVAELGESHVQCVSFPARCGRPSVTWDELRSVVGDAGKTAGKIVFGGCCINDLQSVPPDFAPCRMQQESACFEKIAGKTFVQTQLKDGAFLATPGWLAHWRHWCDENGFDAATAQQFFKESITGIVLLDTGTDESAKQNLSDFAAFADRPAVTMPVGIDIFKLYLHRSILLEKQESSRSKWKNDERRYLQERADFAMALDLLSELPRATSEQKAVEKSLSLFNTLFAPEEIYYLEYPDNGAARVRTLIEDRGKAGQKDVGEEIAGLLRQNKWVRHENGFVLRINSRSGRLRGVFLQNIAFPEYMERYLYIAPIIGDVCGLAIDNAWSYQKLKENENRLRDLATTDSLTRISNRGHFMERAEKELARALRYGCDFSMVTLDIDHFKQFNDTYGHPFGDYVLKEIAALCAGQLRKNDLIGRIGGEEFAMVLVETDGAKAVKAAERIRRRIAGVVFESPAGAVGCTASMGVTAFEPGRPETLETIIKRADDALYRAKTQGRNRVVDAFALERSLAV
ncbi:MAG: diguanylate cyclase [Thermodesulfobacteriota bacterium]